MFQQIRLPELLIIAAIILLLFGAKRLPDAARGLGRSLRIFKAETKGLADGEPTPTTAESPTAITPSTPAATPPSTSAATPPAADAERTDG